MTELITAIEIRDWYAVAALVLLGAIYLWRKTPVASAIWKWIPDGYRWAPPVVLAGIAAFVEAWQGGESVTEALTALVAGIAGIALPAMGAHAGIKELMAAKKPPPPVEDSDQDLGGGD